MRLAGPICESEGTQESASSAMLQTADKAATACAGWEQGMSEWKREGEGKRWRREWPFAVTRVTWAVVTADCAVL